jgi:cell division protein FtsL
MMAKQNETGFVMFVLKVLVFFAFVAIPVAYFIYIKNLTMNAGREVKALEREIIVLKKKNSNLENKLTEKINYREIELKAKKKYGLSYIHENNNKIIMIKE